MYYVLDNPPDAVDRETERIQLRLGLAPRKTNFYSRIARAVEKQRKKRWKRQLHRR